MGDKGGGRSQKSKEKIGDIIYGQPQNEIIYMLFLKPLIAAVEIFTHFLRSR